MHIISVFISQVEYHHLLVKARKFLGAVTAIENYEIEYASRTRNKGGGSGGEGEVGVAMTSLLPTPVDERGHYQGDEMTFSNIAGVIPNIDKV